MPDALLYKVPEAGAGLWHASVDREEEISTRSGYWALVGRGIYIINFDVAKDGSPPAKSFPSRNSHEKDIGTIEKRVDRKNKPGLAVRPDG